MCTLSYASAEGNYKGETGCPVRPQGLQKAVTSGEVEKSDLADHIWRYKGDHCLLWD